MQGLPPGETSLFPDRDAPEQLAADVWRIPLPLPIALRSANVYLINGGPGARILIDSGLGLPADEGALRAGLEMAGTRLEEISTLILTHAHPDHIGMSGLAHALSGAPVLLLSGEEGQLYDVWGEGGEIAFDRLDRWYATHGLEDGAGAVRRSGRALRRFLRLPPRDALRLVRDRERIALGAHTYEVHWTPGHSDFHMCLLREDGLFFAGDHVLPAITPNIGLYPEARPNPLRDYLDSLARVRDLPARLVLPGHGRPFTDLAARADALHAHHLERGARVRDILAEDMAEDQAEDQAEDLGAGRSAAQVAARLFGDRLRTGDDWRFAVAETLAHLEHLRTHGQVERLDGERVRYRTGATGKAR